MSFLAPQAGAIITDVFATLGSLFAMLFALFFMLRDGESMSAQLRDLLPLQERDRDRLLSDTRDLVIASVGAGLAVAAAQGTVGGVAFWLLGLGAPVFWGVVLAFCSLIPVVGAALVWAPAGLWLLLSGETGRGVGMLVVGVLGISMVDNVLRPLMLSGRTQVERPCGLLRSARRRGRLRVHRPRDRTDHPRHHGPPARDAPAPGSLHRQALTWAYTLSL